MILSKAQILWSCSHMNCCQHYHVTHQSTYFIYLFHQVQFKCERISRIQQLLKKLSTGQV